MRSRRLALFLTVPLLLTALAVSACKTAAPQAPLLVTSGERITETGDKYLKVNDAMVATCKLPTANKDTCSAFKAFESRFKAAWPKATADWRAARAANDATKQAGASQIIEALRTELDTWGASVGIQ